ncbi:hypothetical protein ACFQV2_17860 [Actinokineospora soli]|uniref:Polyketide synthase dehydratase domain-containing protein n=1 Tax=Actinokineospora soli TaxID=1048753 RepID=A0ABW2TNX4_9PSEU
MLLPGAALVELALHAGREVGLPALTDLVLSEPLVIPEHGGVLVQVVVDGTGVRVYSAPTPPRVLSGRSTRRACWGRRSPRPAPSSGPRARTSPPTTTRWPSAGTGTARRSAV